MHKYWRAIGFSKQPKRKKLIELIQKGIDRTKSRSYTVNEDDEDSLLAQFDIELGSNYGICVCGQFDDGDEFFPEYYYPYLNSDVISTRETASVERRVDNNSFAGICDDMKVGVTLIFRLHNTIEYIKNTHTSFVPLENTSITLTALSLEGTVMLPIYKSESDLLKKKNTEIKRRHLMNAAKSGDENAMKELTIADMDTYANILSHIQYEDVYSLVESYFMPYGAECELYSVMGEIKACLLTRNHVTMDEVYVMTIDSNGLVFDLAINRQDLYGEPAVGRRFKGIIWLQGKINFPLSQNLSSPEERDGKDN